MTTRRKIDPTSADYQRDRASMMSDASLRDLAARGDAIAKTELARRDLEIGLAEQDGDLTDKEDFR